MRKPGFTSWTFKWMAGLFILILVSLGIYIIYTSTFKKVASIKSRVTETPVYAQPAYPVIALPETPKYPGPDTITPGPSPTLIPTVTQPPFVSGISYSHSAPITSMAFAETDWWQGIVNGEKTFVHAGAARDNPGVTVDASQGQLWVTTYSRSVGSSFSYTIQSYDSPIKDTGVLTITAETDLRLTLQAKSGAVLYFDVPTRQFVDSRTAVVNAPTITQLPPKPPTPAATSYPFPK